MILAGTGHRPDKLARIFTRKKYNLLVSLAEEALNERKPERVISGMAMGWDIALAKAALNLGIELVCAIPFRGQEKYFSDNWLKEYWDIQEKAFYVAVLANHPGNFKGLIAKAMEDRNRWMVDNADQVLALWDGSLGGTCNCVVYAKSQDKYLEENNLWPKWLEMGGMA